MTLGPTCSAGPGSAYGSAADALGWVCLEQNGPWGRDAAQNSHLDAALGRELSARVEAVGGRLVLIRRPGRHADDHHGVVPRTVLLACVVPGRSWVLRGAVDDPHALLSLDVGALVAGDQGAAAASLAPRVSLRPDHAPSLLVCTNGRRDVCCAVRGRPVALDAAARRPGQVWETSHTGGHRFAPTGVVLPSGLTLARLTEDLAVQALDGARQGLVPAGVHGEQHDRGLSAVAAPARTALSHVRQQLGETRLAALSAGPVSSAEVEAGTKDVQQWLVPVHHQDGRTWQVEVHRTQSGPDWPQSCGKSAVATFSWSARLAVGAPNSS